MKIIIAGAGEVGFHLAKLLSYESQEITLIDLDKERVSLGIKQCIEKETRTNALQKTPGND